MQVPVAISNNSARHTVRVIRFSDNANNCYVATLGAFGFSGQAIAEKTHLSRSQVYARLSRAGIKLRDYRDMHGPFAKIIVRRSRQEIERRLTPRLIAVA